MTLSKIPVLRKRGVLPHYACVIHGGLLIELIIALSLPGLDRAVAAATNKEAHLISPALRSIGGRHIKITLPSAWSIVHKDGADQWLTSSFSFTIAKRGTAAANPPIIEILQHGDGRAERHGDFDGHRFTTLHGVSGIEHDVSWEAGSHDWYFAIRPKDEDRDGAIIIRIIFRDMDMKEQRTISRFVYTHLEFN